MQYATSFDTLHLILAQMGGAPGSWLPKGYQGEIAGSQPIDFHALSSCIPRKPA